MTSERDLRRKRILVVDDEVDAAEGLGLLLRVERHTVQLAFSGQEALAIADRFKPEIAVLDLGMPIMDGYELAQRLRRPTQHSALQLIALTGWDDWDHRLRAKSAGFDIFQVKPINPQTFLSLIESLTE